MKKTPSLHFSNTDDARNSASAVLDSYMNTLTMSEWAKNSAHAAQMNSIDNAFTTGRVYSVDGVDGGRFYTDTNLAGNMFIGTQNSLGGFAGSLQIAGLIAHEGTHWYQYQNQIDPRSEQSEYAAHAAQQAVMNNSASHTLSAGEIQQIQVDYEFAKPETLEQYTYNPAGEPDLTSDSAATGNSGTGDSGVTAQEGSFAASHPELDFGDGSLKDNPNTGAYVSQYYYSVYGEYPTETQLEAMVQAITHYAHTLPENAFDGNYTALCRSVVESGVQPDGYADGVKDGTENQTGDGSQTEPTQMPYAAAQSSRPTGGNTGSGGNSQGGGIEIQPEQAEEYERQQIRKYQNQLKALKKQITTSHGQLVDNEVNITNYEKIKEIAKQLTIYGQGGEAQRLMDKVKAALTTKLNKIFNGRIPFNVDNLQNANIQIGGSAPEFSGPAISYNQTINNQLLNMNNNQQVDGYIEYISAQDLKNKFNQLAALGCQIKTLFLVGHGSGDQFYGGENANSAISYNKNSTNSVKWQDFNWSCLKNNATIVMGNCRADDDSAALTKIINDQNPNIKGLAVWGRNYNGNFLGSLSASAINNGKVGWYRYTFEDGEVRESDLYQNPNASEALRLIQSGNISEADILLKRMHIPVDMVNDLRR